MLLEAWQYAKGYVAVEVTGFSVERFLNMAAFHGVYMWDVRRGADGVTLRVSVSGYKLLRSCARKTRCKMKIKEKKGAPFIAFRYRRRKILWGGVIFFALGLYALSSFIWRVDVAGRERLSQENILAFCESYGLKVGAFKYGVDHARLRRELPLYFPGVAWADVHTKGTRATVTVSETVAPQAVIDKETPCHIVAAKDGLITGMVTGAGQPMARRHDVVKQGQLLVSGALPLSSDVNGPSVAYVHAYAEVWAKRFTPIAFTVPFAYTEKQYTGREKTRHELQLLFAGRKRLALPGSSIPFSAYDRISKRIQPGVSGDYPLPFVWVATRCAEFVPVSKTRDAAAAVELAERMLTGRVLREFDFSADIIDKSMTYTETPEGIAVQALITTNERIDAAVPIGDAPQPPEEEAAGAFGPYE